MRLFGINFCDFREFWSKQFHDLRSKFDVDLFFEVSIINFFIFFQEIQEACAVLEFSLVTLIFHATPPV